MSRVAGAGVCVCVWGCLFPFFIFFSPPVLFRALFVTALLFLLLFFNSSEHACRRACARMGRRTHGHAGPGAQLGQEAGREGEDRAPSSASPRCRVSARGGGGRRAPGPGRRSALFGAAEPPCPAAAHPPLLQPAGRSEDARWRPGSRASSNFQPQAPVKLGKALCRAHDLLLI